MLCLLNIPIALLAAIWIGFKQVLISKKLGVSATMIEVVGGRFTMDLFCLKKDEFVVKIIKRLPNASPYGLCLLIWPLYLYYKITDDYLVYPKPKPLGYESLIDMIVARTKYFDAIIDKHKANCSQFVVLGAGLDTRCYNDFGDINIDCFEADLEHNSSFKQEILKSASINPLGTRFVVVDFERDDWFDALKSAGFDPKKKTLLLWEGVTLYLSEEAVGSTLRVLKANLCPGSIITFDLYDKSFIKMGQSDKLHIKKTLEATNEPLKFGVELRERGAEAAKSVVAPYGFEVEHCFILGEKHKRGAFMSVNSIVC